MSNHNYKLNLTDEEFDDCIYLYERRTGGYWLPVFVKEQEVWVQAFEDAKEYFQGQKIEYTI